MVPVALFVFNRPMHTSRTLEALAANTLAGQTPLYIFADGPRHAEEQSVTDAVRQVCRATRGFGSVELIERTSNIGLANNIIMGVGQLIAKYGKVIVLEDDLVATPGFLTYMNHALAHYESKPVFSICGYCPPIDIPHDYPYSTFMAHRNGSWGWGTWAERWESVDWETHSFDQFFRNRKERRRFAKAGNDLPVMLLKQHTKQINSWSIRFCHSGFQQQLPTAYPVKSLIANLGVDGTGTHMKASSKYLVDTAQGIDKEIFCPPNYFNGHIQSSFKKFYDTSLYRRTINWMKINRYLLRQEPSLSTNGHQGKVAPHDKA